MTTMTIVKRDEIENGNLPAAGLRAGADSGNPQLGVQTLAPNAQGNLGIWECQPGGGLLSTERILSFATSYLVKQL